MVERDLKLSRGSNGRPDHIRVIFGSINTGYRSKEGVTKLNSKGNFIPSRGVLLKKVDIMYVRLSHFTLFPLIKEITHLLFSSGVQKEMNSGGTLNNSKVKKVLWIVSVTSSNEKKKTRMPRSSF